MSKAKKILAVAVGPQRDLIIRSSNRLGNVRPYIAGLIDGLAGLKRRLGTDYEIHYREREQHQLADGKDTSAAFRAKSGMKHDLVFPMSTTALHAARRLVGSLPIVFPSVSDHKADGIAHKQNATGISARRSQTAGECLEHFLATVPTLKEVRVLYKPGYTPAERAMKKVKEAAKGRSIVIKPVPVRSRKDIQKKLSAMRKRNLKQPADVGLLVLPVDFCLGAAPLIVRLAQDRKNIPVFFPITDCVKAKGSSALGGYGVPQHRCGELSAKHVDRILWRNAKATKLAVESAPDDAFEWAVSQEAARALNIKLPRMM